MRLNDKFIVKKIGESAIFIERDVADKIVKMNKTAAEICEYAGSDMNKEEIIKMLSERYDVSETDARDDVENIVEKMIELGILEN